MGLFDLPAPVFSAIDSLLAMMAPSALRLVFWGVLAGWITMVAYRFFSDQERIGELKAKQKVQTKAIAEFDGEFADLIPLIRHTLALGLRQLGLALGPALLATLPVLFVVIWVAGEFAYAVPDPGSEVLVRVEPASSAVQWSSPPRARLAERTTEGVSWSVEWPPQDQPLTISDANRALLVLPVAHDVPVIHKKRWWNLLMANPLGYLPEDGKTEVVHIDLPEQIIIGAGPDWMRGWMFPFFLAFLLSSLGFKFLLRVD